MKDTPPGTVSCFGPLRSKMEGTWEEKDDDDATVRINNITEELGH